MHIHICSCYVIYSDIIRFSGFCIGCCLIFRCIKIFYLFTKHLCKKLYRCKICFYLYKYYLFTISTILAVDIGIYSWYSVCITQYYIYMLNIYVYIYIYIYIYVYYIYIICMYVYLYMYSVLKLFLVVPIER